MDTESNQANKPTEEKKSKDGLEAKKVAKKVKRQATQEELDHPLHGVKLVDILESLVEFYGWEYLAREVNILCFKHNPSIKVSIKFLRKFDWAREHVEDIYMDMLQEEVYQMVLAKKKTESKA